jgi:hypothetical protein
MSWEKFKLATMGPVWLILVIAAVSVFLFFLCLFLIPAIIAAFSVFG